MSLESFVVHLVAGALTYLSARFVLRRFAYLKAAALGAWLLSCGAAILAPTVAESIGLKYSGVGGMALFALGASAGFFVDFRQLPPMD